MVEINLTRIKGTNKVSRAEVQFDQMGEWKAIFDGGHCFKMDDWELPKSGQYTRYLTWFKKGMRDVDMVGWTKCV